MEVDRISRIGSVGAQASPSWSGTGVRRRRFVDAFDPALSDDEEESGQQASADDASPGEEPSPDPAEKQDRGNVLDLLA